MVMKLRQLRSGELDYKTATSVGSAILDGERAHALAIAVQLSDLRRKVKAESGTAAQKIA